jgi:hypothetical protein
MPLAPLGMPSPMTGGRGGALSPAALSPQAGWGTAAAGGGASPTALSPEAFAAASQRRIAAWRDAQRGAWAPGGGGAPSGNADA